MSTPLPIFLNIFGKCPQDQITLAHLVVGHLRLHGMDSVYRCPNDCEGEHHKELPHSIVATVYTENDIFPKSFLEQNNFNVWIEEYCPPNHPDLVCTITNVTKEDWVVNNINFSLTLVGVDDYSATTVESALIAHYQRKK
jgi:hypothetical protein